MNEYDVAGILRTYAEQISKARNTDHLKELVRKLKSELNSEAIRTMKISYDKKKSGNNR